MSPPARWLDHDPVSRTLLALYLGVFLVEVSGSHSASELPVRQALALGASDPLAVFGEARYETLVTACFLHVGVVHVAIDALLVWQTGPRIERVLGSARMAPIALVAGAVGNLLCAAQGWGAWVTRSFQVTAGASGAIAGMLAAAFVVQIREDARTHGWRTGWRTPEAQVFSRWLGVVFAAGVLSRVMGGYLETATHLGGAFAGVVLGVLWRRPVVSPRASAAILAGSTAVLVGCIALVSIHDRVDPFATMPLELRFAYAADALLDGRCADATDGMRAVERLRAPVPAALALRAQVEAACGRAGSDVSPRH